MGYDRGDSLVQNRKENCHHDHIPSNVKGNGNIVFSVRPMISRGDIRSKVYVQKLI